MSDKNQANNNAIALAIEITNERSRLAGTNGQWDFDFELAKALVDNRRVHEIFRTLK